MIHTTENGKAAIERIVELSKESERALRDMALYAEGWHQGLEQGRAEAQKDDKTEG